MEEILELLRYLKNELKTILIASGYKIEESNEKENYAFNSIEIFEHWENPIRILKQDKVCLERINYFCNLMNKITRNNFDFYADKTSSNFCFVDPKNASETTYSLCFKLKDQDGFVPLLNLTIGHPDIFNNGPSSIGIPNEILAKMMNISEDKMKEFVIKQENNDKKVEDDFKPLLWNKDLMKMLITHSARRIFTIEETINYINDFVSKESMNYCYIDGDNFDVVEELIFEKLINKELGSDYIEKAKEYIKISLNGDIPMLDNITEFGSFIFPMIINSILDDFGTDSINDKFFGTIVRSQLGSFIYSLYYDDDEDEVCENCKKEMKDKKDI